MIPAFPALPALALAMAIVAPSLLLAAVVAYLHRIDRRLARLEG